MRIPHPDRWLLLALATGVAIAALDLALGPQIQLTGLQLFSLLLAATRLNGAGTAAVSCAVLLMAVAAAAYEGVLTQPDAALRLGLLGAGGLYAAWAARRNASHGDQLADVAATAQRAILRPTSFRLGGTAVSARYRSAADQAVIGGDLYAFADTPAGLRLLIGDVRGKGLNAVRLSAAAIGHFRDCAYTRSCLAEVLRETDRRLAGDLGEEDFITAVVAEIAPGWLTLINCGHHPPLYLPAAGPPRLLAPAEPTTPIGLHPRPVVHRVPLTPGDRLLFYTDGIAEARDRSGTMLDLASLVPACSLPDLDDAVDTVMATMARHTRDAHDDDVALVLIAPGLDTPRRHHRPRPAASSTA